MIRPHLVLALQLAAGSVLADPVRDEFDAIAERIEASDNPYLGRRQIADFGKRLAAADPETNPARVAALNGQLSYEYLRLGEVERGAGHMEMVFRMARKLDLQPTILMHRLRVMVELRRAEVANCITRHNAECCLFPLAGGGLHEDPAPANRARESLLAILGEKPDLADAQWLLNITSMAAGDYPEGVPAAYRIPPAALEPEHRLPRFVDVAESLGVDAFNLCGGVVVEDFDNDGLLDIATSSSDPRAHLLLYRHKPDGTFEEISERAGLRSQLGGLNCLGGDYDNDGDIDLLVLRGGWMGELGRIRHSLLRNDGGAFTDVTRAAGLAEPAYPSQAAVWADFDKDGDLDLYIANESPGEQAAGEKPYPSQLFRNQGDGTFVDISEQAGVRNRRLAKGVSVGDFDNDGDLDLYVSNIGPNRLYLNEGGMRFSDVARELGVSGPQGRSFAPWFFDYDNDGWLDLFVPAYDATTGNLMLDHRGLPHGATPPALYHNVGGKFENIAKAAGLDHAWLPMGASFCDVDNDGFLDIYLATGEPAFESLMPNVLLHNDGGRRFRNATASAGLGHLQKGHGLGFADIDQDGDQDLYHQLGGFYPGDKFHNALFRNPGNTNGWISIELHGTESNRSGIGARIELVLRTPGGERHVHRAVGSVSSFGGSPLGRQPVGLGNATAIKQLKIAWPNSAPQVFNDLPLDAAVRIVEGEEKFRVVERAELPLGD